MATFENIFPTFLSKCGELHTLLQLVAYVLFVVGVIVFVVHGFTRRQLFRYLTRLLVLTSLLVFLPEWGNALQELLNNSILNGLGVDPSDVHNQYKQLLDVKKPDASDVAWWDIVSRITSATVEAMISAFLFLIGKVAAFILWWAYVFQKIILHLGYALSPILIGFMGRHQQLGRGDRDALGVLKDSDVQGNQGRVLPRAVARTEVGPASIRRPELPADDQRFGARKETAGNTAATADGRKQEGQHPDL